MDLTELERAEVELTSLLHKCEAVLASSNLSPSRHTLMTNRVAALRTAVELVAEAKRTESNNTAGPGSSG